MTSSPDSSAANAPALTAATTRSPTKIYSLGTMALAGFIGGPLAMALLAHVDFVRLGARVAGRTAVIILLAFTGLWYVLTAITPPDVLSQWIMLLPQVVLWTVVARSLFRDRIVLHRGAGGAFHSRWHAVGIGIATNMLLNLFFSGIDMLLPG